MPQDQTASTLVRVILHDKNGVEYIASTDRALSTPGRAQCFVPKSRFERAGWSQGMETPFDLSSITCIRVGWGGYIGVEGEEVAFALAPLEAAGASD